jgi:serralysin
MPLTAAEQYLLELINRGRLDPMAEARRYDVGLNDGLAPGTIDAAARQVLAPDDDLAQAAAGHSSWMLQADVFSHTGASGSSPGARATGAGYSWSTVGENIAFWGTTASSFDMTAAIETHHEGLFRSAGHRANLMNDGFREIGVAQERGQFTYQGGATYTASMLTELFGRSGSSVFVTGVTYADRDGNQFYGVGEGVSGVSFTSGSARDTSEAAGGYALAVSPSAETAVTGQVGDLIFAFSVDTRPGNVKIDIVNAREVHASGTIDLDRGLSSVRLLGVGDIDATGTDGADRLVGNLGDNVLTGGRGDDLLRGLSGDDTLRGSSGDDILRGHDGRDALYGGSGDDTLSGGDFADALYGGTGADEFRFSKGGTGDVIHDFSIAQGDRLALNDNLWTGRMTAAQIVDEFGSISNNRAILDFGADQIQINAISSLRALVGVIDIF